MTLEENGGVAAVQQQPKTLNDPLTNKEEKAPAQVEQKVDEVENDKEGKKDQEQEQVVVNAQRVAGQSKGKEGDPQNPSQTGTPLTSTHTDTDKNADVKQLRSAAKLAAKLSYDPKGMQIYKWGNITHRTNSGAAPIGSIRVGDIGYVVLNPTKRLLETPIGFPVLIDTSRAKKGPGGLGVPNNAVVVPDHKKMDGHNIAAQRAAAGVHKDWEVEQAFHESFSHIYYSSSNKNFQRGRIIFDSDSQRLAIMVMEITHKGKWVKAGLIPINFEAVLPTADIKLGTEVSFSTAVWGDAVVAHNISPCALMTEAATEYNTRATLPTAPSGSIAELSAATNKTMGTHHLKLLYRELGRDMEKRVGEKKWEEMKDDYKNPVDILITDNSEGTYPVSTVVLKLTPMVANFQNMFASKAPNPLCWEFLKLGLSPEELAMFDKIVEEKGIGLTVVVEATETSQKTFLEWARFSIARAVTGRNINTKKAFIDSIGVTCSFGNYVTASNFNELVSDSFYDPDKTVGVQSIKIFDRKVPVSVTFCPQNSDKVTVDTDLATRGIVVLSLEAVSQKVSEEDRLSIVVTEEATKASAFYKNNKEVHIKFCTSVENCKLFDKISREYKLRIYYDNNPASRYAGKRPSKGFRTVKCSTVGWSEEQYLALLTEIHSLKNTDFFVMKLGDMVGDSGDKWTRFTIGTEDFRTGKVLAALKLKLPLMQVMGINGFLTRIAVKGRISFDAIEAAVQAVGKLLPNVIKLVVFENKIRKYNREEHKTWNNPQKFQPHYSQYVTALAGFPCPL